MTELFAEPTPPRRVVITGAGVISPLADSGEDLHERLFEGQSGLAPITFDDDPDMAPRLGGRLDFDARQYLPDGKLRPLDRTGKLVIAAARLALENAGWAADDCREREIGLVLGTMYCSLHTIAAFDQRALNAGPQYVRPFDFANTVINAAAGQTAIWHQLRGINATLAGGTAAGLEALAYAADLIRSGRSEAVVAGGGDELCFESFLSFERSGLLCADQDQGPHPVPFDPLRNGMALSEGAALLVLESWDSARRRDAPVLAEILGHASGFDPSRGEDAEPARQAIGRNLRAALADARLDVDDIDAFSAAANGGRRLDHHEALGAMDAFADRQNPLPVTAIKSMVGESLGASGALQTLAMVHGMKQHRLPGIAGLTTAPDDCAPVLSLQSAGRELTIERAMISAVGLDGHVCSLVLGSGDPS